MMADQNLHLLNYEEHMTVIIYNNRYVCNKNALMQYWHLIQIFTEQ